MFTIEAPALRPCACAANASREKQRRAQIDGELAVEARGIERADLVRLEARGVVDQQRQRPERAGGRRDESGDRRVIAEVRAHHGGAPARAHDLVAQRLGLRDGALRMDRDRVARPRCSASAMARPMRRAPPVTSAALSVILLS